MAAIVNHEQSGGEWSKSTSAALLEGLSHMPAGMNLRLTQLEAKCGTSLCEVRAAGVRVSDGQVSEDQDAWQQQIHALNSSDAVTGAGLDPALSTNLAGTTPDGRPLFVSFFVRNVVPGGVTAL